MEEANRKCAKIKQTYENCFRDWYAENFMKGKLTTPCQDEFEEYRECVVLVMQQKKVESVDADQLLAKTTDTSPKSS